MRQRNAKQGPPPPLQIGKPFPDDQSILWKPVDELARAPELATPAVIISQGALREVIRHLSSSPDQELLGFLIGEQCEDPRSQLRYLCITGTLRTGHAIAEEEPVQIPDAEWLGQQLEVRRRRSTLIGWYHSTPFLSPSPSSLDIASHRARFTEPWQCGLIIATEGNEPAGGLFRVHADPAAGGAYIPFYEQVDQDALIEGGRFRTLIDWATYATKELVERDEDERSVHLSAITKRGEPEATPGSLPLMIPTPADDAVPAPSRSRWVPFSIAMVIAVIVSLVAIKVWDYRRLPEPPMAALPPRTHDLVVVPPAAPPRTDSVPPITTAPQNSVGALPTGTSAIASDTTSVAATTSTAPAAVPPSVAPAPVTTAIAAPVPAEIRMAAQSHFDSLADSLEHSLHNYQDRRTDFGAKRLSCKELAYGYRAADEALVGLAKLAGDTRGLDAQRKARYNELIAGMDTVNDDFDASKCKRL